MIPEIVGVAVGTYGKRRRGNPPRGTLTPKWSEWGRTAQFVLEVPMSCTNGFGNVRLMYRLVLAVDVEKYSARDAREQLRAQTELKRILNIAAQNAGLDQRHWYEQVSGDGELVVLPEDVDVSAVVGDFTHQLETVLGEVNRKVVGGTRLRLRVAMHHGTLTPGPFGPAGDAPIVVNAAPRRQAAAASFSPISRTATWRSSSRRVSTRTSSAPGSARSTPRSSSPYA